MRCYIKEKEADTQNNNGEPKEILVKSYTWMENGESGVSYTYQMSKERFERNIKIVYEIYLEDETNIGTKLHNPIFVAVMNYYDFIDYQISDCIGERKIEFIAKQLGSLSEEIFHLLYEELEPLKRKIYDEFIQTQEFEKRNEHQKIIHKYHEDKSDFAIRYGINNKHYDRCYDIFGHLMNEAYLNKILDDIKKREEFKYDSKNYRKKAYQNFSSSVLGSFDYDESERMILEKFYKTLAKRYHPDANPDIDTSDEMKLINKLKKSWGI